MAVIKRRVDRNALLMLFVAVLSAGLALMPSPYTSPYAQSAERARGRVVAADDSLIQQFGIVKAGSQTLSVQILGGRFAGQKVEAGNDLIGKMETDKMFAVGDIAYVVLHTTNGGITRATAYDHYRLDIELLLFGLFAALLICFAGWSGVRALLSFVFAVLLFWKLLLPGILLGYDPLAVALVVVAVLAAATLFLVAGVTRTALVAFIGALLGVLLSIVLAILFMPGFHLHGAILPYSETLLYTGFDTLNLTRLFIASVFIGASGSLIDVAIDVSASMGEVARNRPDLSFRKLVASGLAVGRAMTSTMVTTLLTAYTAGYMALLMVFIAQGVPPASITNTNFVAAEVMKTLVGSFGLVTVAPFTALVGGFLYTRGRVAEPSPSLPQAKPRPAGEAASSGS
ncbi:MAG: YibE/F family protein [Anaerolineae bacterium]